jgi:putative transposase
MSVLCPETPFRFGAGAPTLGAMARTPRIEVPDGYFHVHTRGNDRQDIYFGNWSGRLFLRELERAAVRSSWRILAYCLMTNHYHLVLQVGEAGCLSDGMEELNGRFARTTNRLLKRTNHLFGDRFKSWLIEDDDYLYEVTRYVLLNPLRARLVRDPRAWRWSSMGTTVGFARPRARFLDVDWILGHFCDMPSAAPFVFSRYVAEGIGKPRPMPPEARASR